MKKAGKYSAFFVFYKSVLSGKYSLVEGDLTVCEAPVSFIGVRTEPNGYGAGSCLQSMF